MSAFGVKRTSACRTTRLGQEKGLLRICPAGVRGQSRAERLAACSRFMSDLAHLKIQDDPAIRESLSWYLEVAENQRPAKLRFASTLATHIDPRVGNCRSLMEVSKRGC